MGVIMAKIDDSCVTGYLNGDPVSAQRLTGIFRNRYRRYGFSEHVLDEIAQETMTAMWNKRDEPGMKPRPGSYSARINMNKANDAWRKKYRNRETPIGFYPGSGEHSDETVGSAIEGYGCDPDVLDELALQELVEKIDSIADSLPAGAQRGVIAFMHKHLDDLSLKEIGETMGIESLGTIKALISRGKKLLRRKLDRG
jgi:RNA polymerase sigma factor (sigma-70 family)